MALTPVQQATILQNLNQARTQTVHLGPIITRLEAAARANDPATASSELSALQAQMDRLQSAVDLVSQALGVSAARPFRITNVRVNAAGISGGGNTGSTSITP